MRSRRLARWRFRLLDGENETGSKLPVVTRGDVRRRGTPAWPTAPAPGTARRTEVGAALAFHCNLFCIFKTIKILFKIIRYSLTPKIQFLEVYAKEIIRGMHKSRHHETRCGKSYKREKKTPRLEHPGRVTLYLLKLYGRTFMRH